jgi:exopolyphosphatase/guanosine-5'-triphosphate,3'-diphosphate pyrophosphatase
VHAGSPIAAVIDIGSSSVRLAIAHLSSAGTLEIIDESRVPTRLADGLNHTGQISDRAMRQTLSATVKMVASARAHHAQSLRIVATAAMRDASNASAVRALIENACQHPVEIIPGDEEARLGFRGAISSFGPDANLPDQIAIVDIGGGSTQLSIASRQSLVAAGSTPIGAVRLHDVRQTLPGTSDLQALTAHAQACLQTLPLASSTTPFSPALLIATGGTASALAMMHYQRTCTHDQSLALKHLSRRRRADIIRTIRMDADVLDAFLDLLLTTPSSTIAHQFHIQPDRAELLPAGAVILRTLCRMLARPPLAFTTGSIRDAILLDLLHAASSTPATHPGTSTHPEPLAPPHPARLPSATPGG